MNERQTKKAMTAGLSPLSRIVSVIVDSPTRAVALC
jgi:hypothetical protein